MADRRGRRDTLLVTIAGLSLSAAAPALLPTYAQVGFISFVLFTLIRFIVGIFAGGEYAAGHPFAIEYAPKRLRGIVSGAVQGGFILGVSAAAAVIGLFVDFYGTSGFVAYGWRYLFLTGLIPLVIVLVIRIFLPDSPIFQALERKGKIESAPFLTLFKKPVVYDFLQVMLTMTGLLLIATTNTAFIPFVIQHLPSQIPLPQTLTIVTYSSLFAFCSFILCGALSQVIGRRKMGMIWAVLVFVTLIPLFYLMFYTSSLGNFAFTLLFGMLISFVCQGAWGFIPAYLAERFRTAHRASGLGFGYSSGVFIGGWVTIYVPLMHQLLFGSIDTPTNAWFSAGLLGTIGALLFGVGFLIGPETLNKDLAE
jgi:MFS family permease